MYRGKCSSSSPSSPTEEEVDVKVGGGLDEAVAEGASPTISPQPAVKRPADSEVSPAKKPK